MSSVEVGYYSENGSKTKYAMRFDIEFTGVENCWKDQKSGTEEMIKVMRKLVKEGYFKMKNLYRKNPC